MLPAGEAAPGGTDGGAVVVVVGVRLALEGDVAGGVVTVTAFDVGAVELAAGAGPPAGVFWTTAGAASFRPERPIRNAITPISSTITEPAAIPPITSMLFDFGGLAEREVPRAAGAREEARGGAAEFPLGTITGSPHSGHLPFLPACSFFAPNVQKQESQVT